MLHTVQAIRKLGAVCPVQEWICVDTFLKEDTFGIQRGNPCHKYYNGWQNTYSYTDIQKSVFTQRQRPIRT
jgi:hypothetical protein